MTTAIPSNLNLGLTKPTTVPAYCRRVESIATNAQTFSENSTANIVLDTSTPGSFLDPQQSLLQFDIELRNENPYVDYVNLSASGMAAVIQDMRIICQGTPIEEMFDYNLMFEMFMDLGGHMQEEFKMYMENGWRAPVHPGETDLNFVKPPMIDREGIIMNPNAINMFGDANAANTHWEEGNQTFDRGETGSYRTILSAANTKFPKAFKNWPNPELGYNHTEAKTFGYRDEGPREPKPGVTSGNELADIDEKICYCNAITNTTGDASSISLSVDSTTGFGLNDFVVLQGLDPLAIQVAPFQVNDQILYRIIAAPANNIIKVKRVSSMTDDAGNAVLSNWTKVGLADTQLDATATEIAALGINTLHFFSQAKSATDSTNGAKLSQLFSGCNVIRLPFFPDKEGLFNSKQVNVGNYIHLVENDAQKYYGTNAPGNIRTACWTNRIDNTYVTWPQTLRPEPIWKNESRMRMEGDTKKYRVQDYLQFLANVKNIPVGISSPINIIKNDDALRHDRSSTDKGETDISKWNFTEFTNYFNANPNHLTNATQSYKCTVTLPIFSGILGVWAEKQFPSMLISPGSFYIQIKFASAQNAFQLAMDPCRRIHGTYRDYVPNCGLPNYYATEFAGQNISREKCLLTAAVVSRDLAADGYTYTTPATYTFNNTRMAITPAGAKGHDFAWSGIRSDKTAKTFGFNRRNVLGDSWQNPTLATAGLKVVVVQDNAEKTTTLENPEFISLNGHLGQEEGHTTGNAKPQYVPRRTPWKCLADYWGFGSNCCKPTLSALTSIASDYGYVRERDVCYGTYLPASTAQVRRTRSKFNSCPNISQFKGDTYVQYFITNLKYVGIQTILPDEVTASIVRQAASSDISLHAQSCRTYKSLLSQSTSQNLILPVKVASANSMWVIFQNTKMQDDTHYCSLTRNCPLSLFQWTPTATNTIVGSNTVPMVKSVQSQNAFQIQLRIGNELLPIQPMTCVSHIVTELMRSVHGLGDMNTELPLTAYVRNKKFTDIKGEKPEDNIYNTLKSGDFLVPYVPIEALDDQTITNNPIFMDYHNAQNTGYQNFLGNTSDSTHFNDRERYVLPEFLPPISKFLLGFDLDTFPGTNNVARSGRYLGNAPLTLQMTNVHAAAYSSIANTTQDSYSATAVVLHDIRFSIMAGGQILAYY